MCLNMFIGMAGCLLPSLVVALLAAVRRCGARNAHGAREPLLSGADADGDGDAAPAASSTDGPPPKTPVKGLLGLLVVSAPTVRHARLPAPLMPFVTLLLACVRPRRHRTPFPPSQVADLAATTLSNIGLLYITVSVYQMLRGAVILWNTLFGVLFLGKRLNRLHYTGLLLAVTGIVIVGAASLLAEHAKSGGGVLAPPPVSFFPPPPPPSLGPVPAPGPSPSPSRQQQHAGFSLRAALSPQARTAALRSGDPDAASARWVIVGMGMIVVSQLIQAAGMTMEEFVLRKYELSSTQLVGYEGGVGVLLMAGVFLPVR
jgi:drug/metabolite transporter (DMT)-like permease